MEVGRLSKDPQDFVCGLLDVFEEQDAMEEAIFIRSDGRGVVEFILGSVAYDFSDLEWGGGTN
jgi:hypothetical protein